MKEIDGMSGKGLGSTGFKLANDGLMRNLVLHLLVKVYGLEGAAAEVDDVAKRLSCAMNEIEDLDIPKEGKEAFVALSKMVTGNMDCAAEQAKNELSSLKDLEEIQLSE